MLHNIINIVLTCFVGFATLLPLIYGLGQQILNREALLVVVNMLKMAPSVRIYVPYSNKFQKMKAIEKSLKTFNRDAKA
jgi:hypothetical protein